MYRLRLDNTGFNKSLDGFAALLGEVTDEAIKNNVEAMKREAGYLASDFPSIRVSTEKQVSGYAVVVTANGFEPAWVEFGTGLHAAKLVPTLPQDWQDYAKTFYINGMGRTPARPFLYTAFKRNSPEIIPKIIEKLK